MAEKMLVISAHVGDFVWRSAGTIAKYVKKGTEVHVIVLTNGVRGESASYWKTEGATLEGGSALRKAEAEKAARILGVHHITFMDYDDFPLEMGDDRLAVLAEQIRRIRPDFIVTHDKGPDYVNPDHHNAAMAVMKAYSIASAYGAELNGTAVSPRQTPMFGFEPMTSEPGKFNPDIYIDITEEFDQKMQAMECLQTQKGSLDAYVQKAILRGSYCAGRGGRKGCKYAESFSMYIPVYSYGDFVW